MATTLDSFDNLISAATSQGVYTRFFSGTAAAVTAATSANPAGYITGRRYANNITLPNAFGTGVQAAYLTAFSGTTFAAGGIVIVAIEYVLGTLTVSGNSFAAGVSMPTKILRISGSNQSVQTATLLPIVVATAALTATTPTLTVTYTNQSGTGLKTATLSMPTNVAINTGYNLIPTLATGDTGVQAVTNMSISAGTVGTLKVYGLLPLGMFVSGGSVNTTTIGPLTTPEPIYPIAAGESLGFYEFGTSVASQISCLISLVADI